MPENWIFANGYNEILDMMKYILLVHWSLSLDLWQNFERRDLNQ